MATPLKRKTILGAAAAGFLLLSVFAAVYRVELIASWHLWRFRHGDHKERVEAAFALGAIGAKQALPALIESLPREVQGSPQLVEALKRRTHFYRKLPLLLPVSSRLRDIASQVRSLVPLSLTAHPDLNDDIKWPTAPCSVHDLVGAALQSHKGDWGYEIKTSGVHIAPDMALFGNLDYQESTAEWAKVWVADPITTFGVSAIPDLIQGMEADDPAVRLGCALMLSTVCDEDTAEQVVAALVKGLSDPITDVWCLEALGALGETAHSALDAIKNSMRGKDASYRFTAARAMAHIRGVQNSPGFGAKQSF